MIKIIDYDWAPICVSSECLSSKSTKDKNPDSDKNRLQGNHTKIVLPSLRLVRRPFHNLGYKVGKI